MRYSEMELDRDVRLEAFKFLTEQMAKYGEILTASQINEGFRYHGESVFLKGTPGIFKPRILPEVPISITTVPEVPGHPRPYDDRPAEEGVMIYRYRRTGPNHPDNEGLRKAMAGGIPLIYFYGVERARYQPIWPVFVIDDDPSASSFRIMVDEAKAVMGRESWLPDSEGILRRRYITVEVQQRLHQVAFRAHVLRAYHQACSICSLRHPELLEAAHIFKDTHPKGIPAVSNGLSMCAIHHKAFDKNILGITPDYSVIIREDVLEETDGPMLQWGLQAFQDSRIHLPRRKEEWPDKEALEERYDRFKAAV